MRPKTKTGHMTVKRDRLKEINLVTTWMWRVNEREASRTIFRFWLAQLKV